MNPSDIIKPPKLKLKSKIIAERLVGLKYFDQAVTKAGRQKIVEETIKIHKEFPNTWGSGWSNIYWAAGNAVHEILNRYNFQSSWNLNEAFTEEEMIFIASQCGLNLADYKDMWPRKI